MTPLHTKFNKNRRKSGVTLIECLVVLSILAGLIAAVGASFTMVLKSYVGEYASEGSELESQRAALELEYFASKAINTKIMADPANPTTTGYTTDYLGGTRVELTRPNGTIVVFQYRATGVVGPNGAVTPISGEHGYPAGITYIGELGINIRGEAYVYTTKAKFVPLNNWRYPFKASSDGGLAFRWTIPTPASGDINVGGSVPLGL